MLLSVTMDYKLKHNPIPYIMEHAADTAKLSLLLKIGFLETKLAKDLLLTIMKKQNPDGGFPNQFDKKASGLKTTYSTVALLVRCGMPAQSFSVQGALSFILKQQRPDGGFAEARDVPIPEWMTWESKEKSVTYYTARVIELLHLVGMSDIESFKRAVSWLRGMQHPDGTYPVYEGSETDPNTTVGVAFLMRELYGEHDEVYKLGARAEDHCFSTFSSIISTNLLSIFFTPGSLIKSRSRCLGVLKMFIFKIVAWSNR
jgi:prenyltransferase beta subunit